MFEQTWILWGLPLILIPVIIHLLNRLRYRPKNWAAMEFLLRATRHSTKQAKLRQFLILACRVLTVLFLILAISRLKIGGWVGLALSGPPETVIIMLDRSSSMSETNPGTDRSKREIAIDVITRAAEQVGSSTRYVLIENVLCSPEEIPNAAVLDSNPLTQATDTAADIDKMLEAALLFLLSDHTGRTEIWIASDLQKTDWSPDNERWGPLIAQLQALDRPIRFRLLAMPETTQGNSSLTIQHAHRRHELGEQQLELDFALHREQTGEAVIPIRIELEDQATTTVDVTADANEVKIKHSVNLGENNKGGWGRLIAPKDSNPFDNVAWFVYGDDIRARSAVFAENQKAAQFLRVAAAPSPEALNQEAVILKPEDAATLDLSGFASILWQGPMSQETAEALSAYVKDGGILVLWPGDSKGYENGLVRWGPKETAPVNRAFTIAHWDRASGPLADSSSGQSLPVDEVNVFSRRRPAVTGTTYADFAADGTPFLVVRQLERGYVAACATAPAPGWSNLNNGTVLVPMLQRFVRQGAANQSPHRLARSGEFMPSNGQQWVPVGTDEFRDVRWDAGVYRHDEQLLALNRPEEESSPVRISLERVEQLFAGMPFRAFHDKGGEDAEALPGELWRTLLFALLVALLLEMLLTLPRKQVGGESHG